MGRKVIKGLAGQGQGLDTPRPESYLAVMDLDGETDQSVAMLPQNKETESIRRVTAAVPGYQATPGLWGRDMLVFRGEIYGYGFCAASVPVH